MDDECAGRKIVRERKRLNVAIREAMKKVPQTVMRVQ